MDKTKKSDITDASDEIPELAQAAAQPLAELAQALVSVARALKPRTRTDKAQFERRIRRAISRSKPDQDMLRAVLQAVLR